MIRKALHTGGMALSEGNLSVADKQLVTNQERLTFGNLKQKERTLALQLYMQFFGMAHTQKYTMPELRMAWHFTKAFLDPDLLEVDWSDHLLQSIYRIQEGSRLSRTSRSKKKLPLALGAPLVLTRIVYYALDAIHHLSPPLTFDGATSFVNRSNALRSPIKKAKKRQKKDESESEEEVVVPLKKKM